MFLAIDTAFCSAERVTIAGSMTSSLTRVDDLAGDGVQSLAVLSLAYIVDDDRALEPGVLRDLAKRLFERPEYDPCAGLLVLALEPLAIPPPEKRWRARAASAGTRRTRRRGQPLWATSAGARSHPIVSGHHRTGPRFPADLKPLGLVLLAERPGCQRRRDGRVLLRSGTSRSRCCREMPRRPWEPSRATRAYRDRRRPGRRGAGTIPPALREAILAAPAVGRTSPDGKPAVVNGLTSGGHNVAMIGDGVNDVPGLKQAQLAPAQGSGTQMSRSVTDLVLVRDDFGVLPGMVDEGRQIRRNIQRVARLFITNGVHGPDRPRDCHPPPGYSRSSRASSRSRPP